MWVSLMRTIAVIKSQFLKRQKDANEASEVGWALTAPCVL